LTCSAATWSAGFAPRESAELAQELIAATCDKEGIARGQLTLHADRGTSMRSKPVPLLLADLGVAKSHSRPHVSDDNPYSEAQFKTLKYQPDFPARFDSLEHARAFYQGFFAWYNHAHRHSGIGYMTPAGIGGTMWIPIGTKLTSETLVHCAVVLTYRKFYA
jgi:putative transposase